MNKKIISKKKWSLEYIENNGCPFCGTYETNEGPCGGCSINIRCIGCGARFNIAFPFYIELIGEPTVTSDRLREISIKNKQYKEEFIK